MVDEIIEPTIFPHLTKKKKNMLKAKAKRKWNFSAYTVFLMSDLFILADSLCAHGSLCATCIYPGGFVPIKKRECSKINVSFTAGELNLWVSPQKLI